MRLRNLSCEDLFHDQLLHSVAASMCQDRSDFYREVKHRPGVKYRSNAWELLHCCCHRPQEREPLIYRERFVDETTLRSLSILPTLHFLVTRLDPCKTRLLQRCPLYSSCLKLSVKMTYSLS